MEENKYKGFTPDYIETLLTNQVFVFGSNALGYHTGGASGSARKWPQTCEWLLSPRDNQSETASVNQHPD